MEGILDLSNPAPLAPASLAVNLLIINLLNSILAQINDVLTGHVGSINLHRLNQSSSGLQTTYLIHTIDQQTLAALLGSLRQLAPDSKFSFIE